MRVLGCTGGIGSGKTYVSAIFGKMGVPLYNTDDRAKGLYDTDMELRSQLVALLGDDIVENGMIRRDIMAGKIFGNKELLSQVEMLVHPAVMRDFNRWKQQMEESAPGFVIMESAILLEKPIVMEQVDKVLTVSAPLEVRIERVMARDNVDRSRVEARMAAQWSDELRESLADFIIFADGKRALLPQVEAVYDAMNTLDD
jgi:dephospho-CoA kinase